MAFYYNAFSNKDTEQKSNLKATTNKIAASLIQKAEEEFKNNQDSLGAETCLKIFAIDNKEYKQYLIKAAEGFEKCMLYERAKKYYSAYIEKYGMNEKAFSRLAVLEFKNKKYSKTVELLKQIPLVTYSSQELSIVLAKSYYELGQYDECIDVLTKSKIIKNQELLEMLAVCYEKMSDYKNALKSYQALLSFNGNKNNQDYYFKIANLYKENKEIDLAKKQYEKNISFFPKDFRNYEKLAYLLIEQKNYYQTQRLIEKAIGNTTVNPIFYKILAQSYAGQGQRPNAILWYKKYLEEKPEDYDTWHELAAIYFEQEKYKDAIDVLKIAILGKSANTTNSYVLLGKCYLKLKDINSAIESFEKAKMLAKNNVIALSYLAECYKIKNDNKKLTLLFEEWINIEPQNILPKYELGKIYVSKEKYKEAISLLENVIKTDSLNVGAHLSLAKAYEKTQDQKNRFLNLKIANEIDNKNAETQFELGRFYFEQKRYEQAKLFLEKAISLSPDMSQALFEYGLLLNELNNKEKALEYFILSLKGEPVNTSYLLQTAKSAYMLGKKDVALSYISKACLFDSSDANILTWAGIIYKENGFNDTAKQLLLKTIRLNKACALCYKHLGDIYLQEGQYDLSIKFYKQSLTLGSYNEQVAVLLGTGLFLNKDYERAKMMFEKVYSQNPKNYEALYRLCSIYMRQGNIQKAKELFAQAQKEQKNGWVKLCEADIYAYENKLDNALISYNIAIKMMPNNDLPYAGSGYINLKIKKFEKAIEDFGNALGRQSCNIDYLIGMGKAYEGMKNYIAAFESYAEGAKKSFKNPEPFYLMGCVLNKQKEYEKAILALERCIKINSKDPYPYYELGNSYNALSKFKEAIVAYEKALKLSKNDNNFIDVYKKIGDIYNNELKDQNKAVNYYKKYKKKSGKEEKIIALKNSDAKEQINNLP